MWNTYMPSLPININMVLEKNQDFMCEMVNLKRDGWLHYTKALNNLTYDFWKPLTEKADQQIENLAESMKLTIRLK